MVFSTIPGVRWRMAAAAAPPPDGAHLVDSYDIPGREVTVFFTAVTRVFLRFYLHNSTNPSSRNRRGRAINTQWESRGNTEEDKSSVTKENMERRRV